MFLFDKGSEHVECSELVMTRGAAHATACCNVLKV